MKKPLIAARINTEGDAIVTLYGSGLRAGTELYAMEPDTDIAAGLAAAGVHTHDCQCPACEVTRRIADNQRAAAKAQEGKP